MKSLIVLSLSLFFILPAGLAQQSKLGVQIKLQTEYDRQNPNIISLLGPSPSLVWIKPNNRRYQLEWSSLRFAQRSDSIRQSTSFYNAFRFEAARFHYSQSDKLHFWLAGSVLWYQRFEYANPFVSSEFLQRDISTGFVFDLVPMMLWNLSDRLYLDIGIPIEVARIDTYYEGATNPTMPVEDRHTIGMDQQIFQAFRFRIGLGMWL